MNPLVYRILGIAAAGGIILALTIGVGVKLTQKAEGYKAQTQNFHTFEPHSFIGGCYSYALKPEPSEPGKPGNAVGIVVKPEVKK
jgi:hypothetical protein